MAATARLSQDDISRLMSDRSASTQVEVAAKLASHYNATGKDGMKGKEAGLAEDIFRLLLSRAEVQVRELLALSLKQSHHLPAEIAKQMASDVYSVSLPIIEFSEVLTDEDLLTIIGEPGDSERLQAIARRETVSETVSEALVETQDEKVVTTLVQNEGAQIATPTFEKIVDHHPQSANVMEALIQRGSIPVGVVEKVIDRLSGSLRENIEQKYGSLVELKELRKALDKSLEVTSLKMIGLKTDDQQLARLITHLESAGKLSPFSALCMANLQLFEVAMSRMLRIPLKNVGKLLRDPGGLRAAYQKAELPESMMEAVELAVQALLELEEESIGTGKQLVTPFQVMERMRMMMMEAPVQGTDYLLNMMQHSQRDNLRASMD